ncbi:zonadhesin-like [Gigantopelta aegis]|uniref:zonadhesin-like n=1 Tax=Gigantopelta aegis TaxID=1735272 RepID=UPI001B88DD42|nr:zonadhesin-like [Gigantopelta aegis]
MIPLFHAAGHIAYAISARLYLDQMKGLMDIMSAEQYYAFKKRASVVIAGKRVNADQSVALSIKASLAVTGQTYANMMLKRNGRVTSINVKCGTFDCAEKAECVNDFCTCPTGYHGDGYHGCYQDSRCGCYSHGDPKLVSFDKATYDLPVPCMYVMSRYQSDTCNWDILLEAEHRSYVRDNSSVWIKRVVWTINGESGEINRNGIMFDVSGSLQTMNIPYDSVDISLRRISKFYQILSSVCDLDLRFDGRVTASLDVPGNLNESAMLGMCGDCDGAQTETITVVGLNETGTSRTNKLFSFFHITPEESGSVCVGAVDIYSSCTPDYLKLAFDKSLCGGIFDPDGPFTACRQSQINTDLAAIYYFQCLHDFCLTDETAACDVLGAMATACNLQAEVLTC